MHRGDEFADLSQSIEHIAALISKFIAGDDAEAPRMELLTRLVTNPHSGWSASLRESGRGLMFEYTKSVERTASMLEFPSPIDERVVSRRIFEHEATVKHYVDWIAKYEPRCLNLRGVGKISTKQLRPIDSLKVLFADESDDQNIVGLAQKFPSLQVLSFGKAAALTSLLGAERLTNLVFLSLPYSGIRDIEPITELIKLVYLNIAGAPTERIGALSNKYDLRMLDVSSTKITSIEPLRACKRLDLLRATGIELNSLAPLDELDNLKTLSLDKDVHLTPALLARQRAGTLTIHQ